MSRDQKRARWFGVLFLITFVTSIPALALYETVLRHPERYIAGAGDEKQVLLGALLELLLIILATGYRPSLGYLGELGALDPSGAPLHVGGISTIHVGLVYMGPEYQRSFASNTLRGVSADAAAVIAPLVAWINDAPGSVGVSSFEPVALAA